MDPARALKPISVQRLLSWALVCLVGSGCAKLNNPDDIAALEAAPTINSVTSAKADGTYGSGDVISIEVTFSDVVTATGTPRLTLNSGGNATYSSGSGSKTLTFTYTVGSTDSSSDLDYSKTTSLTLNGGSIKNSDEVDADLSLPQPGTTGSLAANKALVIEATVEFAVTSVTASTANGSYKAAATVSVEVVFSEAVTVNTTGGTPYITLETGATDRNATYVSGSLSTTLVFTYTVQAGDTSSDLDYNSVTALSANGGTIINSADGTTAPLTLPSTGSASSLAGQKAIVIDTTAPQVSSVSSSTANGYYNAGDGLAIDVTFDEDVTVTTGGGTPYITLEMGGTDRNATYSSGSTTTVLTFSHTVQAGDTSLDLDYNATNALSANGGTITDTAGNTAVLTLPALGGASSIAGQKAIVIDTTAPQVTSASSSTANGTKIIGQSVTITVTFDESMAVSTSGGTPYITLETGATDRNATYASTATTTLSFTYTVQSGDASADLDYNGTGALSANSGTITDLAGNTATLTLPAIAGGNSISDSKNIVIDGVAPSVTNVTSSTGNGTYVGGQAISIQVTFDQNVTVTGFPQLTLETGSSDAVVNYASGTGGATLTFTYTIASGEASTDLNYQSTSALALNSGTIVDANGNAASLTLPGLAAAGALAVNKALVVDAVAPTVSYVTSSTANGTYDMGDAIMVQVVFSEAVTVDLSGGGTLKIVVTGDVTTLVDYTAGSTTDTLNFLYTVPSGQYSADLNYSATNSLVLSVVVGDYVRDAAGNDATLTLPAVAGSDSLAGRKALVVDARVPTVTAVSPKVSVAGGETITITGTNFRAGATVAFLCDDHLTSQTLYYCSGQTVASTSISCPFMGDGAVEICGTNTPLDGYDVQVTNVDTTAGSLSDTLIVATAATWDTGFDSDGKQSLSAGDTESTYGITVDSAGRAIVVGTQTAGNKTLVSRFTAVGAADGAFNTTGYNLGGVKSGYFYGVASDSSNDIFAAGTTWAAADSGRDFRISKYSGADGSLTWTTTSEGGRPGGYDVAWGVKAKSNGKIVAVGANDGEAGVLQLNSDGTLDTGFNTTGYYSTSSATEFRAVAIQSDLKVVAVGTNGSDIFVARLTTAGILDTTFDTDGMQTVDCGLTDTETAYSVALDSSQKILIAAQVADKDNVCIVRLTTAGALDGTFDTDGIKTIAAFGGGNDKIISPNLAVQGDGKITVSAHGYVELEDNGGDVALFRLTSTGALDTTFDTDGKVVFDNAVTSDSWIQMALEPITAGYFGRIFVTSQTGNSDGDIWLGRIYP